MANNLQIKKEPADEIPLSDVGLLGALRDSSLLRFVGATLMWGTGPVSYTHLTLPTKA